MANQKDVPYQTLMKILLSERVKEEKLQLTYIVTGVWTVINEAGQI